MIGISIITVYPESIKIAELFCFESKKFSNTTQKAAYIAKRFAAKEACAKAIGTGFAEGILWKDIQLISNRLGKPDAPIVTVGGTDATFDCLCISGKEPLSRP